MLVRYFKMCLANFTFALEFLHVEQIKCASSHFHTFLHVKIK